MTLDLFFEQFEHLADAPNGVQKLRELILQLAVQGKLVPQDPNDEPASLLLKRIRVEREHLVKAKKINKVRAVSPIADDEVPYELPKNWEWVRLAEVGHDWGQKKPDEVFTYIDVSSINKEQGVILDNTNILQPDEAPSRARKLVCKGTVIYATVRPYLLNIAIVDRQFEPEPIVSTAFAVIHPFCGMLNKYLYYYLRSKSFVQYVEAQMKGMAYPAINDGQLYEGLIPIPPSNEQKQIVAKVEQLTKLCDELEERQKQRRSHLTQLNEGAIAQLLTATPDEFSDRWQRICNNFDLLYSLPENISKLRQAILQLAVRGKLVPQDPNNEPASELLERIRLEKEEKVKEGKIRRAELLPPVDLDDAPYQLPQGWKWVRFPELGQFGRGKSKHRPRNDPALYKDGKYPLVQTGDVARANGVISTHTGLYNDVGLAQSRLWQKGTLCITIAANIADAAILDFDACFPDSVVGLVPSEEIGDARYFMYFMRTAKERLLDYAPSTAQKNINVGILEKLLIPLPPRGELQRIVAKVDCLMELCDSFETKLIQAQADNEKLMEAAVRQVLAA